jgi:hypothetical protein
MFCTQREDKFPEICGQFMPHGLMPALLATGYRVNDRHFTRRQVQGKRIIKTS